MPDTLLHLDVAGLTLYAKPLPASSDPSWDDDVVELTEGATGEYSASVDAPTYPYGVYRQLGASPASTDGPARARVDGPVYAAAQSAATQAEQANTKLTNIVDGDAPVYAIGPNGEALAVQDGVEAAIAAAEDAGDIATEAVQLITDLQATVGGIVTGDGDYAIDHNGGTGDGGAKVTVNDVESTTDILRFVDGDGDGIDNVTLKSYPQATYDAGNREPNGTSVTGADGRWLGPLNMDSGDWYVVASKPGVFQAKVIAVTVP